MDMKKVLSALSVLFILAACQKEVDDEVPATADGCLLVRMVQGVGRSAPSMPPSYGQAKNNTTTKRTYVNEKKNT